MKPNIPVHYQKGEHSMWNIVSQCCIYYADENCHRGYHRSCKMLKQMYIVLSTNLWRDMFCFERSWQTAIDISFGPHKRIRLSLEDRLVQAKEIYLIPWMILESEIFFVVKSTPTTTISMDHRSFGHYWTAKVYTYRYWHGPQIIWASLNSQSLHLQISAWTTDHLVTTEQPKSTPTNISMDHRSFGHHWTAKVYTYKWNLMSF
jgi:hypothetical protein